MAGIAFTCPAHAEAVKLFPAHCELDVAATPLYFPVVLGVPAHWPTLPPVISGPIAGNVIDDNHHEGLLVRKNEDGSGPPLVELPPRTGMKFGEPAAVAGTSVVDPHVVLHPVSEEFPHQRVELFRAGHEGGMATPLHYP